MKIYDLSEVMEFKNKAKMLFIVTDKSERFLGILTSETTNGKQANMFDTDIPELEPADVLLSEVLEIRFESLFDTISCFIRVDYEL